MAVRILVGFLCAYFPFIVLRNDVHIAWVCNKSNVFSNNVLENTSDLLQTQAIQRRTQNGMLLMA